MLAVRSDPTTFGMSTIIVFLKYRRNGLALMASTKFCQRICEGQRIGGNLKISPSVITELRTSQKTGRKQNAAPSVSARYTTALPRMRSPLILIPLLLRRKPSGGMRERSGGSGATR